MKKVAIILTSIGAFVILAFIVIRATHTIDVYKIATPANMPTFHEGEDILTSALKHTERGNFVCFTSKGENYVHIFRCIAKAGDVIEIRNAVVYLNGKLLAEPYTWNEYYISKNQLQSIQGYIDRLGYPVRAVSDSVSIITFSEVDMKNYHLDLNRFVFSKSPDDAGLYPDFEKLGYSWDHFGPIKVPAKSYFLMGDSRHDAIDSRRYGFVSQDQVVSTALN